jgi:hypothetical protein
VAGLLGAFGVQLAGWVFLEPSRLAIDFVLYRDAASRWLAGGTFYLPHQLAGPYVVRHGDILYPPPVLALLVPFTALPALLWWAVPLAIVTWVVWRHQPSETGWLVIAACLAFPATSLKVATGNPVLWAVAAAALGTVWAWPYVGVLLKPTLAPFALLGATRRSWWLALGVAGVASLLVIPLWQDYLVILVNAQHEAPLLYSVQEIPMVSIPVVAAWFASRGRPVPHRPA